MASTESNVHLSRISTQWDLLFQAHHGQQDAKFEAQRVLLQRYCGAVYRYLLASVHRPDAAEELSQEFALRFLRGDFRGANPERGRFRDFLKTALYHLVVDYRRCQQKQPLPLPSDSFPVADADSAAEAIDEEFDHHWRQELLDRTWESLEKVQEETGSLYFVVLRWRAENPETPAKQLVEQLGATRAATVTETGIRQILHRAREKFADLLLDEVARSLQTAAPDTEQVEQELIDLELLAYCRPALERWTRHR